MLCRRCKKESTAQVCKKCRHVNRPKGFFERRIKEIDKIMAKRPPLEELNRLWSRLRSHKAVAEQYGVPVKHIEIWMGQEHLLRDPYRFYDTEIKSWGIHNKTKDVEDKIIRGLYKIKKQCNEVDKRESRV